MRKFVFKLIFLIAINQISYSQLIFETLVNSTFKIRGSNIEGTAFIIGYKLDEKDTYIRAALVTAKHVLDDIDGDYAILELRKKNDSLLYEKLFDTLRIKKDLVKLYTCHSDPSIDIACMRIDIPKDAYFQGVTTNLLAYDSILEAIEFHPGDQVFCYGFPKGMEANNFGFPVLRSGYIASYPITPSKTIKSILLDMEIFSGNSGSPVFYSQVGRLVKGNYSAEGHNLIIGVVVTEKVFSDSDKNEKEMPLMIASIIPASYILETLKITPDYVAIIQEK